MSSSTADLPPSVVHHCPASDDSSDDEPLIKMKTTLAEKSNKNEKASSRSNGTNKKADDSSDNEPLSKIAKLSSKDAKKSFSSHPKKAVDTKASDDSSDDEPLIKMKEAFAEKPEKKEKISSTSNGAKNKDTGDSSETEPLIKIAKKSSRVAKSFSEPPKKSVDRNKKDSPVDDNSLDDEPLSDIAKKLKSRRQRKVSTLPSRNTTPVIKSKRSAARKMVKYAESSSDSSDDESLAAIRKKRTKATEEPKKVETDHKDKSLNEGSSDDNEPLVNLIKNKKKPVKKNTKRTTAPKCSNLKKREGLSDESSDDEPLINIVKKKNTNKQTKTNTKAGAPKRRNTTPKKPRKRLTSDLSSNNSDDEPLIEAGKHPQVTKILRIILERCDGEEAGPTQSLNKSRTAEPLVAAEPTKKKWEGHEDTSEDE